MSPSQPSRPSGPSQAAFPPAEASGAATPRQAAGVLHVVATPIGNLRDITLRALEILGAADAVVCEDTRVTGKLLAAHGLRCALVSYHEHNADRRRPELLRRLAAGETLALVADAGTPLISDPGYKLVRAAQDASAAVRAVPGPSAAVSALAVAGLPTDRFLFQGFLPHKTKARRDTLAELANVPASLVVYESPQRLGASLADMAAVLGDREAAVVRELTKRFEESVRATLPELAEQYGETTAKGEIVVVIAPPAPAEPPGEAELDERLRSALAEHSLRDAVTAVTRATGLPRKQVYTRALALRDAEA